MTSRDTPTDPEHCELPSNQSITKKIPPSLKKPEREGEEMDDSSLSREGPLCHAPPDPRPSSRHRRKRFRAGHEFEPSCQGPRRG
eukprot:7377408-Prymnesium_polylepis.2